MTSASNSNSHALRYLIVYHSLHSSCGSRIARPFCHHGHVASWAPDFDVLHLLLRCTEGDEQPAFCNRPESYYCLVIHVAVESVPISL